MAMVANKMGRSPRGRAMVVSSLSLQKREEAIWIVLKEHSFDILVLLQNHWSAGLGYTLVPLTYKMAKRRENSGIMLGRAQNQFDLQGGQKTGKLREMLGRARNQFVRKL